MYEVVCMEIKAVVYIKTIYKLKEVKCHCDFYRDLHGCIFLLTLHSSFVFYGQTVVYADKIC